MTQPRTNDSAGNGPQQQYAEPSLGRPLVAKHPCDNLIADNEADGKHQAVPSDGNRTEMYEDRVSSPCDVTEH